jgi:hypothetical protein
MLVDDVFVDKVLLEDLELEEAEEDAAEDMLLVVEAAVELGDDEALPLELGVTVPVLVCDNPTTPIIVCATPSES